MTVEPCLTALNVHVQQRGISYPDSGWMSQNTQVKAKAICPAVCKTWGKPELGENRGNSVGTAVLLVLRHILWCSPTTLDLTVKGPLPLHGAVISEQRKARPSTVTTEPANQSGRPLIAALSLGSRTCSLWGAYFAVILAWSLSQTKYTVQGRESTVIQCIVGDLPVVFVCIDIHKGSGGPLEIEGEKKNYCSFWELALKGKHSESTDLSLCVFVCTHVCMCVSMKVKSQRERPFENLNPVPWSTR